MTQTFFWYSTVESHHTIISQVKIQAFYEGFCFRIKFVLVLVLCSSCTSLVFLGISILEEQKSNSLQMHPRQLFHSGEASLVRIHLFKDMDVSVSV